MKDEIEYEDATLNVASIFEGIDEIVNIDFTLSGEAWRRMGDSDLFSLSMKNVNQGIEYGNLRAFFKTQVARILLFINHVKTFGQCRNRNSHKSNSSITKGIYNFK